VQVVMTPAATEFITPLTLSVLSRHEVVTEMFPPSAEIPTTQWTKHVELGLWADVMLIAPASANTIAKMAYGLADNFLTTLVLALRCPLIVAPTMDVDMYQHEVTQRNIAHLREQGCWIVEPESGELASGLSGPGRLPEVDVLVDHLTRVLSQAARDLSGKKLLVTAGPTQEPIDPVRYVGNRSSGKMGFALAMAAAQRGAEVTLVAGPVSLETPRNVRRIDVGTAREMERAVLEEFAGADALVMAAAVADFTPASAAEKKIKREHLQGAHWSLELTANPDILKTAGEQKGKRVIVGFALETDDGEANARRKLGAKNCDLMILNSAAVEGAGVGSDTNIVTILSADGSVERIPRLPKIDVAHKILTRIVPLLSRG
jgi:phosphopantothenoylcysteine decarboxylase/phosphopantothenate--cysteine ligase